MFFQDVIPEISRLCKTSADFITKSALIQDKIIALTSSELLDHLDSAGIIPECFDHDSTEEKLFAKYCDALVSRSFTELGLVSEVIRERADAADVLAKGSSYQLVADAKAFRLSRTAKNQKDFKIEALNTWRKGADFACLVGPIFQYPMSASQIYSQAIRYNVALLSFTHVAFMIRNKTDSLIANLKDIWSYPGSLSDSKNAAAYWLGLNDKIVSLTGKTTADLEKAISTRLSHLKRQAEAQLGFWEAEKNRIEMLPHEEAVSQLIEALKIDAKIDTIKKNYT